MRNLHAMKNVGRYNFNYSSACHFLRGSCLLLGAKRTELCQQLDELAQSSRPESSVIMFFFFLVAHFLHHHRYYFDDESSTVLPKFLWKIVCGQI